MKWLLIIPGCLIVLIFLISLLKVKITISYSAEQLRVETGISFISFCLYPAEKKHSKPSAQKAEPAENGVPKKSGPRINLGNALDYLDFAADALKRFGKILKLELLDINAAVSLSDPMKTAMGYGSCCAAVSILIPKLEKSFGLKKYNINIESAFDSPMLFEGRIRITARILSSSIAVVVLLLKFNRITTRKEVNA